MATQYPVEIIRRCGRDAYARWNPISRKYEVLSSPDSDDPIDTTPAHVDAMTEYMTGKRGSPVVFGDS